MGINCGLLEILKMAVKFLSRDIQPIGPYLTLCASQSEYLELMRHLGVEYPDRWIASGKDATRHTLAHGDTGELVCVVCIDVAASASKSLASVCGLLAHEAAHVWQSYADDLGESSPGIEQEAYAIGMITQTLVAEYLERVKTPDQPTAP